MSDNIDVTPGTGKTVATDDVSGVQYQVVKLDQGGDGVSSPVTDLATGSKQTTGNTSLGNIDTSTTTVATKTTAIDTNAGATGDASVSAGATGSISAKLRRISADIDSVKTNTAAATPAGTNVIGKVGIDQTTPGTTNLVALAANQSVNVAQMAGNTTAVGVGASSTGTQRVVQANDSGKTLVSTGGSASSSGNNTLIAAGTNKLKVKGFSLSTTSTTAVTCIFQSGAGGTELWRVVLQAVTGSSTGANLVVPAPDYIFATASATLLNLNLSGAQTVHWSVQYYDEA